MLELVGGGSVINEATSSSFITSILETFQLVIYMFCISSRPGVFRKIRIAQEPFRMFTLKQWLFIKFSSVRMLSDMAHVMPSHTATLQDKQCPLDIAI